MLEGFENYEGREQSAVKHEVLRRYLNSFTHIVGFKWHSITYIDGFSGPWNAKTDDLSDTSFSIALDELRRARNTHSLSDRQLKIRCVFVEKEAGPYQQLKEFADAVDDAEILPIHGEFEEAIPEIMSFVQRGSDTFPFTLIDPTGSSGFKMKVIAPLLQLQPSEVLINFMLEFIRRYIEQEGLRKGLSDLFGTDDFDENLANLSGIDRDDAITDKYCECLRQFCNYHYVLRASVLHPDKDRLHFQLIYGTRHYEGVAKFKRAEEQAMQEQEKARAHVEEDRRKRKSGGQTSFLVPEIMPESDYYIQLRNRYLLQARHKVVSMINSALRVDYDDLWVAALSFPMVWEKNLRQWLKEWRKNGQLEWKGLAPRGRELIHGKNQFVLLVGSKLQ